MDQEQSLILTEIAVDVAVTVAVGMLKHEHALESATAVGFAVWRP